MDEDGVMIGKMEVAEIGLYVLPWLLVIGLVGVGIFLGRVVIDPQRHVDRVRKSRGIDPMMTVRDEKVYFKFLRAQYLAAAVGVFALAFYSGITFARVLPRIYRTGVELDQQLEQATKRAVVINLNDSVQQMSETLELMQEVIDLKKAGKMAEAKELEKQIEEKRKQGSDALDRAKLMFEEARENRWFR